MTTRASHADDEAVAHWIGNEQEYDWLCAGLVKDILDGWNSTSSILLMRQICKIRWIVGVEAWIAGWFFRMLGAHSSVASQFEFPVRADRPENTKKRSA